MEGFKVERTAMPLEESIIAEHWIPTSPININDIKTEVKKDYDKKWVATTVVLIVFGIALIVLIFK
jgi:hypothetical protein